MATMMIEPMPVHQPELIRDWLERIEEGVELQIIQYTVEAGKKNKMQVSYLLSNIGRDGYRILKSYCAPNLPTSKTFAQLKTIIETNICPAPPALSEGYVFSNMKQEVGETIPMFMARLREKANMCNFAGLYDRMVKDRFIYGQKNDKLRSHLLNKTGLDSSAQVLAEAIKYEANNAVNSSLCTSTATTNSVRYRKEDQQKKFVRNNSLKCSRCTLRGHEAGDCQVKCRKCRGIGHIQKNCPRKRNNVHHTEDEHTYNYEDRQDSESTEEAYVFYVQSRTTQTDTARCIDPCYAAGGVVPSTRSRFLCSAVSHVENPTADSVMACSAVSHAENPTADSVTACSAVSHMENPTADSVTIRQEGENSHPAESFTAAGGTEAHTVSCVCNCKIPCACEFNVNNNVCRNK